MWQRTITQAYEPEFLFQRFAYQCEHTYPNRIKPPNSPARVNKENVRRGLTMMAKLFFHAGVISSYRRTFWKMAKPAIKKGKIERILGVGLVAHHLIEFTKECAKGQESASFYSQRVRKQ